MCSEKRKSILCLAAAFAVPLLLLLALYAVLGIAPFGDETLAFSDAGNQYVPFFKYYRDMLLGKQDAFYLFEKTLGGSVTGLFAYYLASPLNLIFLLFSEENILSAFDVLVLVKLSLASVSMALFLQGMGTASCKTVLFAVAYAFCGYNTAFCWSVMWLDGVILLPLVALGIHRIFSTGRFSLYVLSLALAIITSFYIGYALCIFSLLYFLYLQGLHPEKRFGVFVISSLAAGGLSAVLLVPAVLSFSGGKRESGFAIIEDKLSALHRYALGYLKSDGILVLLLLAAMVLVAVLVRMILKRKHIALAIGLLLAGFALFYAKIEFFLQGNRDILIKSLFGYVNFEEITQGSPNIYVGVLVLMLAVSYFFSREIPEKERLLSAAFCAVILLSFALLIPNLIWHGFTRNNWFNYRYSFVFCFFVISLAAKASFRPESLLVLLLIPAALIKRPEYISGWQVAFCTGMIAVYAVLMHFKKEKVAAVLQIAALCLTVYVNFSAESVRSLNADAYRESFSKYSKIISEIQSADDGFYRIRKFSPWLNYNDPMTFGFNGISHFSSTEKTGTIDYLADKGYWTFENIYTCGDDEYKRESDDFLGVRYYIGKDGAVERNQQARPIIYSESGKTCEVDRIRDSRIVIRASEGKLITTIPYEKGWHVRIDGVKTDIIRSPDIFMSVNVPEGEHVVEFRFSPPGLVAGTAVSVLTALLMILSDKKRKTPA